FRSSADWQRIRAAKLARDPLCEYCEQAPAVEVDHKKPIGSGGAMRDRANLASSCRSCHSSKTRTQAEGRHWTPPIYRGCDERGYPRDPEHPWHRGGSITSDDAPRPMGAPQNR